MEHRWSVRKPHQCSVVIDCPRNGPVAAKLRDICIGGMFVETGNIDLPVNASVSIAFTLGCDDHREDFRLPAMVVRRTAICAGIMFLESGADTLRTLRRALYVATTLAPEQSIPRGRRIHTELDNHIVCTSIEQTRRVLTAQ